MMYWLYDVLVAFPVGDSAVHASELQEEVSEFSSLPSPGLEATLSPLTLVPRN